MLDPKQKGNLTELQCITSFYELGARVSIPYGENTRYDFIADVNNILIRVQVKTSKYNETNKSISFSCRSCRVNASQTIARQYTKHEIDYFCTYYNNTCYLVPVEECSKCKVLRLEPSKNNQSNMVNYADDYELSKQLKQINKHR